MLGLAFYECSSGTGPTAARAVLAAPSAGAASAVRQDPDPSKPR